MSYRSSYRARPSAAVWLLVVIAICALCAIVVWLSGVTGIGDYVIAHTFSEIYNGSGPFWAALWASVFTIVAVVAAVAGSEIHERGVRIAVVGLAIAVAVVSLAPTFLLWRHLTMGYVSYDSLRWYAANVADSDELPAYDERLNVPQARQLISRGLDGIPGDLAHVTPLGTDTVCGTVERDGPWGHRYTTTVVCLDENTGEITTAPFAQRMVGTINGSWGSKLGAQLTSLDVALSFDDNDVYGYIDGDGNANLVVPVTRMEGGMSPRRVPAGVVTFNHDGHPELHREVEPGQIPGPVLPESVAAQVRQALNTRDGYIAYRHPKNNPEALETTDRLGEIAAADPNAENVSEWILRRADGRVVYVTPLTAYGSGRTVVAYLEVEADEVADGTAPNARLVRLADAQASPQDITQRVTTLYDADIDWATNNELGASDNNLARIYEVTPGEAGQVVLTVGTGVQTLYRVRIDAGLDEANRPGEVCVYAYVSNDKIRCDEAGAMPAPVGSLRGLQSNSTEDTRPNSPSVPGDQPLAAMSADELAALIEAATAELLLKASPNQVPVEPAQ